MQSENTSGVNPEQPSPNSFAKSVGDILVAHQQNGEERAADYLLGSLIQRDQYVGEVYSMGYENAIVQIHDHFRQKVGGIPGLSFLIATRLIPGKTFEHQKEDSSILLLRVMDAAQLPNHAEAERIRAETAQRATGEEGVFWDEAHIMDAATANVLSFAGVKCRIIGTFYLTPTTDVRVPFALQFGCDISNYYPNRGLKVYKPNDEALQRIVNYRDQQRAVSVDAVNVGAVRYASTNRSFQGVANVPVEIVPEDLLGQKTALFGMTRIGKSNTTKIILQSVFNLRFSSGRRVGQIVFDPNGEYANENVQDRGALKNLWRTNSAGDSSDVVTYGSILHPNDPNRRLMLVNFFADDTLQIGKEIIDAVLAEHNAIYISNFRQIEIPSPPSSTDFGPDATRKRRRILVYKALLAKAGFPSPAGQQPSTSRLFSQDLLQAMSTSTGANAAEYQEGATLLGRQGISWDQLALACQHLDAFIHESGSGYNAFNASYMANSSTGDPWADEDLKKLLRMFGYANGARLIGNARPMHTNTVGSDYAADVYRELQAGRLVIVDQSGGEEAVNRSSAERIMRFIFSRNQSVFRAARRPPDVLVYVEEAHNLLPSATDVDYTDIWVRTAKEGAKYNLGLVYATQEVSSIQKNILKNTSNWFIGHLNNTDETKELVKYYDFADFESSIRRAQDKGFLRVKTLSNLFVVPVQVRLFEAPPADAS